MAVPLAVFIFLFAFIPLVGAVVSGALAVVVALVTQGVFTAVMVLVVVLAVQQIEGHILQPFILGRAVRVHPLAVVLSVAAGGMVAGIGGAVVAVPLVAVTNTVVGYLRVVLPGGALGTLRRRTGRRRRARLPGPPGRVRARALRRRRVRPPGPAAGPTSPATPAEAPPSGVAGPEWQPELLLRQDGLRVQRDPDRLDHRRRS